jgi:hypothetical protein
MKIKILLFIFLLSSCAATKKDYNKNLFKENLNIDVDYIQEYKKNNNINKDKIYKDEKYLQLTKIPIIYKDSIKGLLIEGSNFSNYTLIASSEIIIEKEKQMELMQEKKEISIVAEEINADAVLCLKKENCSDILFNIKKKDFVVINDNKKICLWVFYYKLKN